MSATRQPVVRRPGSSLRPTRQPVPTRPSRDDVASNPGDWPRRNAVRIYISADMEGVTGLVDAGDVQPGGADYEAGRVMMTEDVNAAVRGAVGAGASRG